MVFYGIAYIYIHIFIYIYIYISTIFHIFSKHFPQKSLPSLLLPTGRTVRGRSRSSAGLPSDPVANHHFPQDKIATFRGVSLGLPHFQTNPYIILSYWLYYISLYPLGHSGSMIISVFLRRSHQKCGRGASSSGQVR